MSEFKLSYTANEINEKLGKVATPDWSVNDPNVAGYVANKTHWSEVVEGIIAFNGDLTGKEYVDGGDGVASFVKMSDTPKTIEELVGSTVIVKHNMESSDAVEELTVTEDMILRQDVSDVDYVLSIVMGGETPVVYIVHGDVSSAMPLSEGVYFIYVLEGGMYFYAHSLSCLTGMVETVHKIDEKYLPDTVAKKEDVINIIDVVELPTTNIKKDCLYRCISKAARWYSYNGSPYNPTNGIIYCVEEFPETGQETGANGEDVLYCNITNNQVAYFDNGSLQYKSYDVVYNISEASSEYCVLLEPKLYMYRDGWVLLNPTTADCSGLFANIFNDFRNIASGEYSHAEGGNTTASGEYSHAEGRYTTASGFCSHAEGYNTIASGNESHVQGTYNIEDTEHKYAHIVGNGTGVKSSNAHTLDWSGNAWFAGSVEGTAIILPSPNGTRYQITVDDNGALTATAIVEETTEATT